MHALLLQKILEHISKIIAGSNQRQMRVAEYTFGILHDLSGLCAPSYLSGLTQNT